MIGKINYHDKYGEYIVISKGSKSNYFKVKFTKTGNISEFRADAIKNGQIRDKYAKSFLGVGIIGDVKTRGKNKPYYTVWRNMLYRCLKNNYATITDDWFVFENFLNDVPKIDGWNEKLFLEGKLHLDKDYKQRFQQNKIYSKDTCKWLPKEENIKIQDNQQKMFIAISPSGDMYEDYNITDFGRKHNLERRQISAVLHGRYNSTKGWKFYYKKEIV